MKLSRSKLGKKKGMTRNQKRKAAYAAKAAEDAKHRREAGGGLGKHLVKKKVVRLVGTRQGHRAGLPIDCPNIGCRRCNPSGRQVYLYYYLLTPVAQSEEPFFSKEVAAGSIPARRTISI